MEVVNMSSIDFQVFRIKHIAWKTMLKAFLEGRGSLAEEKAVSHKDCDLGKWLYAEGLKQYGKIPEMRKLETVHEDLHAMVRRIISLKRSGDPSAAELEYRKIGPISDEIVSLLTTIEGKVKSME
jgi:methyl-accepting chemotaxis protein